MFPEGIEVLWLMVIAWDAICIMWYVVPGITITITIMWYVVPEFQSKITPIAWYSFNVKQSFAIFTKMLLLYICWLSRGISVVDNW